MSARDNIEKFCTYFDREIESIKRLSHRGGGATDGNGDVRRYRKVLIISVLDTLSGIRFNPTAFPQIARKNRQRFLRFISEHATWREGALVSLPFLSSYLTAKGLDGSALAKHVDAKLAKFSTDTPHVLKASRLDEPLADLLKLATCEGEQAALEHAHHPSILYRYRNYVVHESRTPGYAMEISEEPEAHYNGYINDSRWFLAYPYAMLSQIAKTSIASLRAYFIANDLDPYDSVPDTTRW